MIYSTFEKAYKDAIEKTEILVEQTQQAYEFWANAVLSSAKEFFKAAKTK